MNIQQNSNELLWSSSDRSKDVLRRVINKMEQLLDIARENLEYTTI
jgi:ElaB/YqjD/DUF883 family membrane-anchored ribosome-binding protein